MFCSPLSPVSTQGFRLLIAFANYLRWLNAVFFLNEVYGSIIFSDFVYLNLTWQRKDRFNINHLTLSHPEALPRQVKLSSSRQSKIIKWPVLAGLGEKGLILSNSIEPPCKLHISFMMYIRLYCR